MTIVLIKGGNLDIDTHTCRDKLHEDKSRDEGNDV